MCVAGENNTVKLKFSLHMCPVRYIVNEWKEYLVSCVSWEGNPARSERCQGPQAAHSYQCRLQNRAQGAGSSACGHPVLTQPQWPDPCAGRQEKDQCPQSTVQETSLGGVGNGYPRGRNGGWIHSLPTSPKFWLKVLFFRFEFASVQMTAGMRPDCCFSF